MYVYIYLFIYYENCLQWIRHGISKYFCLQTVGFEFLFIWHCSNSDVVITNSFFLSLYRETINYCFFSIIKCLS